jgi:hypothetical protein
MTGFGVDRDSYLLKEGRLRGGVWDPGSLDEDDPMASFTLSVDLGDFQQGSLDPQLNREFAEFLVGTPAILSRKDLIRKTWMWSAQFAQYNADLLTLVQGLEKVSGDWDVMYIGSDEIQQDYNGYAIPTALVAGRTLVLAMWYGKITAEAVGPKLPGTAHSTYDFKAEAFVHPDFETPSVANDSKNYGAFLLGPVGS